MRVKIVAICLLISACAAPQTGARLDDNAADRPPSTLASERPSPVAGRFLASIRATPGPTTRAGRWVQSPVVSQDGQGWAMDSETGRSIRLLLLPQDADDDTSSLISVEAMAALGVHSARLVVLDLYRDTRALPQPTE